MKFLGYRINGRSDYRFLPGLTGLYLHTLLRDFGRGLVNIFLPLYAYQLTNSLLWPFFLVALYHAVVIVSATWVPKIISRVGLDWSAAILSIPFHFRLTKSNLLYSLSVNIMFKFLIFYFSTLPNLQIRFL